MNLKDILPYIGIIAVSILFAWFYIIYISDPMIFLLFPLWLLVTEFLVDVLKKLKYIKSAWELTGASLLLFFGLLIACAVILSHFYTASGLEEKWYFRSPVIFFIVFKLLYGVVENLKEFHK